MEKIEVLRTAIALILFGVGMIGPCQAETRLLSDAEKRLIADEFGSSLKDPNSAQYRWANLVIDPSVKGSEFGYCFQVNAKNSYGGYTGFRTIAGMVKRSGGKIISYSYTSGVRDDEIMAQTTKDICRILGYVFQ